MLRPEYTFVTSDTPVQDGMNNREQARLEQRAAAVGLSWRATSAEVWEAEQRKYLEEKLIQTAIETRQKYEELRKAIDEPTLQ
jgi:hypothetical protein